MAKQTILALVGENAPVLLAFTTHNELREFAIQKGLDSAAGFSGFKKALLTIGIDYDQWKRNGKPVSGESHIEEEEETPLQKLAKAINGRLWIKGEQRRIYSPYGEGDNYHYKGKWWLEFDEDGEFKGKCWLEDGYSNKKSEEYMAKHIRQMKEICKEEMKNLGITCDDLATFESIQAKTLRIKQEQDKEKEISDKVEKVRELV